MNTDISPTPATGKSSAAADAHATDEASPRTHPAARVGLLLVQARTLVFLVLLVIVFGALSGDYLSYSNIILMIKHVSINAVLAIGVTFVILTGGIDLSVGSTAGIAGMIGGGLIYKGFPFFGGRLFFSVFMVIVICLLAGSGIGAINGIVITRFKVAPFIATLGMLYVARGFADLLSNGNTFPNLAGTTARGNTGFDVLGVQNWLGIPVAIWIMIALGAITIYATARTPFGRRVFAVGGNEAAARLAGIRVSRVKVSVYIISGACAALAGLILTSELGAAYPDTATSYELNAIAAAVLGGTALSGGRGTIIGTVMGAFVIGFLNDGLVLVGVSTFWQQVVIGAVIVLAVITEQAQQRLERTLARRAGV